MLDIELVQGCLSDIVLRREACTCNCILCALICTNHCSSAWGWGALARATVMLAPTVESLY